MHNSAVLIHHVYGTVIKYLDKGTGSLKGMTNMPSSAYFKYKNMKTEYLKNVFTRISHEIESHHYSLSDFILFIVYNRLVSMKKSIPLSDISSRQIRYIKKNMSSDRLKTDTQFIKDTFADTDYKKVSVLFTEPANINDNNTYEGNIMSALVKNGLVSPVTYAFFHKRLLTSSVEYSILSNNNLTVFHREIEVISFFIKGVGYAN